MLRDRRLDVKRLATAPRMPHGALAEVVEHGRTGFLVQDEREMAEAIHLADRIKPEACRVAARRRFSAARMVERYLARYQDLVAGNARRVA